MKKFINEFKKFITRGNVMDLAVGVIVGSAFTAIVNALSNNVFKPLINYFLALILGKSSLTEIYTILKPVYNADNTIDLTQSIYIDWGAFINAILNFIIIAFVLFCIVRFFNKLNDDIETIKKERNAYTKKEIREFRKQGYSLMQIKKMQQDKLIADENARKEQLKKEEEEKKKNAPPTTEQLLTEILQVLKDKKWEFSSLKT